MFLRRSFLALLALMPAALADKANAQQQWPTKPVRFIVPYAPGGIADTAARIIGAKLTDAFGHQIVVENRPGGNGAIGMALASKLAPDGYAFLVATSGDFILLPAVVKDLTYDVQKDFVPMTPLTDTPIVVGVHSAAPYKTLDDLFKDAKAQPGKISFASPGTGSVNQLFWEAMALASGTTYQHIPYKGGAPAGAAVAAGDVPVGTLAVASALPHIKTGRVRMLAQMGAKRSEFIPDVPTLQESGLKDIDGSNWTLLAAPKGTPQPILDRMHAEVLKAVEQEDVKTRFKGGSSTIIVSKPAELTARINRELATARVIVEKAKITAD